MNLISQSPVDISARTTELFRHHQFEVGQRTDRLFGWLLLLQWAIAVIVAIWISPRAWDGANAPIHVHVWAALLLGGCLAIVPTWFIRYHAGQVMTRHLVGIAQMLFGVLFIHLTGGRIETHFHIFGSLALLAFYRDWRVLITSSGLVAADHLFRGLFWPHSVYGIDEAQSWRWLEHAGWMVFEDVFLIWAVAQSVRDAFENASRQAQLEATRADIENTVEQRTSELREQTRQLQAVSIQMAASEAVKEAILGTAGDAILTIDPDGRIDLFNPAAERIFGYRRTEVLGQTLELLMPELFKQQGDSHISDLFDTPAQRVFGIDRESIGRRKDGSAFPVELNLNQTLVGDRRLFTCILRDLTNRKKAEAEIVRAKTSAEEANRAKSEFLANMSHEIRTPMNGILGMTELALSTDLSVEQREYLVIVKKSADALLGLLNDILDFSKIEAGMLALDPHDFGLRESLDDILKTVALRAHQKGLELILQTAPDVPDFLVGDPLRLRQVLVNLLGNAIKFTDRGEVVLSVKVAANNADGLALNFSVRDTGIGIARDKQLSIFDSFTQADGSTTRHYGGSGLGLAISAKLVRLMEGSLTVESEVGQGSVFQFTAHLQKSTAAPPLEKMMSEANLQGVRVLIVDDNAINRQILQELLTSWEMKPKSVDGGQAALAELRCAQESKLPYHLVLMDAMMPAMDGFTVVEEVRRDVSLASAEIMMLSSADRGQDIARCRAMGVSTYLIKPIQQAELLKAIRSALGAAAAGEASTANPSAAAAAPTQRTLKILLAEDNQVNQMLAFKVLTKRGHEVVVANNGREALEAWRTHRFDAILMDVQMPEMDGVEATQAIRVEEQESGQHTPIIALTAHAMKGDRERFLAVGMDAFVAKPLRTEELLTTLTRLTFHAAANGKTSANRKPAHDASGNGQTLPIPPTEDEAILDRAITLARVEGDYDLLQALIGMFEEQSSDLLAEIRTLVHKQDGHALERAAHKLKGSVGTFGAAPAVISAQTLESSGRRNQWDGTEHACSILERQVARLKVELSELVNGGAA